MALVPNPESRIPPVISSLASLIVEVEDNDPNEALVKPLLDLLVGGSFDEEQRFRFKDSAVVLLLLELAPQCGLDFQVTVWKSLAMVLQCSYLNVNLCSRQGVLLRCLDPLMTAGHAALAENIAKVFVEMASYNVLVPDLKTLVASLQCYENDEKQRVWPQHAVHMVQALREAIRRICPDVFFSFNGAKEAAVTVPPLAKWPGQPGFTINTWIRLDPKPGVKMATAKPVLYWFRTGRGFGYSAHFSAYTLVVTACSPKTAKGRPQTHQVGFQFQLRKWYMVTVVHSYNRLKACEMHCYVNGQFVSHAELPVVSTKEPYDKCYLGTSPMGAANDVFSGQMTAFYLFQEPLSPDRVSALHHLGPAYKGQFRFPGESDAPLNNLERKLLYDGKLANGIVFLYSPKACDGQLCLESSPTENPSFFVHSPHATLLEGVQPVTTQKILNTLHCIGGIQVLFSLFDQLDAPHFCQGELKPNYQMCAIILQLLVDILERSAIAQQQMVLDQGFLLLSDLLQQVSPKHLSLDTVNVLLGYACSLTLRSGHHEKQLLRDLFHHVLFNMQLWIHSETVVQIKLLSTLATEFALRCTGSESNVNGVDLRQEIPVSRLMDMLQHIYWLQPSAVGRSSDRGVRPNREELLELRSYFILIVRQLMTQDKTVWEEEIHPILSYLMVEVDENIPDVLQLLVSLVQDLSDCVVPIIDRLSGLCVFFRLLKCDTEEIRISALKGLGLFLHSLPYRRKAVLVEQQSIFPFLSQFLTKWPLTRAVYTTLIELLVDEPSSRTKPIDLHNSMLIYPDILEVIFGLVLTPSSHIEAGSIAVDGVSSSTPQSLTTSLSTADTTHVEREVSQLSAASSKFYGAKAIKALRTQVLKDLLVLIGKPENCRGFLQISKWQNWMVKFIEIGGNDSETADLAKTVIISLLMFSLKHEKDGWQQWLNTAAAVHIQVSSLQEGGVDILLVDKEDVQASLSPGKEGTVPSGRPSKNSDRQLSQGEGKILTEQLLPGNQASQPCGVQSGDSDGLSNAGGSVHLSPAPETAAECTSSAQLQDESDTPGQIDSATLSVERKDAEEDKQAFLPGRKETGADEKMQNDNGSNGTSPTPLTPTVSVRSFNNTWQRMASYSGPAVLSSSKGKDVKKNLVNLQSATYQHLPPYRSSPLEREILSLLLSKIEHILSTIPSSPIDQVIDESMISKSHPFLLTNIVQLVVVVSDTVIMTCGGLDGLLKLAMAEGTDDCQTVNTLPVEVLDNQEFAQRLCSIAEIVVLRSTSVGQYELPITSAGGGVFRQVMRLVMTCTILSSLGACEQLKEAECTFFSSHSHLLHLQGELESATSDMNLNGCPLHSYLSYRLRARLEALMQSQSLLTERDVNRIYLALFQKVDEPKQTASSVMSTLYILSKLLVVQYERILKTADKERPTSPASDRIAKSPTSALKKHLQEQIILKDASQGGRSPSLLLRTRSSSASTPRSGLRKRWQRTADGVDQPDSGDKTAGSASPILSSLVEGHISPCRSGLRLDITLQLEAMATFVGQLLKDIVQDFHSVCSNFKTTSGQELLGSASHQLNQSSSSVELIMQFCSQEWQMAVQRLAGSAFTSFVVEGNKFARSIMSTTMSQANMLVAVETVRRGEHRQRHRVAQDVLARLQTTWKEEEELGRKEMVEFERRQHAEASQLWRKVCGIMSGEYGPWRVGQSAKPHQFLRLDLSWEDKLRRRLRFLPNPYGSTHPEAVHQLEDADEEARIDLARELVRQSLADSANLQEEENVENVIDEEGEELEGGSLEPAVAGRVVETFQCLVIAPGLTAPGTLTCTTSALYFAVDEDSEEYTACSPQVLAYLNCLHAKWEFSNVTAVYSRRYLHQNTAVEIFFISRTSVMFSFQSYKEVRRLVALLPRVGIGSQYGLPVSRATSLLSPFELFRRSNMTQRWQRREVSNFEYLMFANTIAGRTYNDLNQYPVFPWILSNYYCKHLDLSDPGNFRNLSKPIGALNPDRIAKFDERYELMSDDTTVPPFYYGTHYSTAAFTMSWLIRVEPFTSMFLQFQSGKFDMPDRTFSSMGISWQNCLEDMADVKELIPEHFYMSDMYVNKNKFAFGVTHNDETVNDVQLPPWASSPEEFVRLHSLALESEHVSNRIHEWIDLIFGFKQRGEEAVKAKNVFYYLTYEGSLNLDSIENPANQQAIKLQIRSFGQTPAQILREPHPARNAPRLTYPLTIDSTTAPVLQMPITPDVPLAFITTHSASASSGFITTISCNQTFAMNKWTVVVNTQSVPEPQLELDPVLASRSSARFRRLGEPLDQSITPSSACFAVTEDCRHIIAAGYWDYSFKCFATESGRLVQSVFGHRGLVTCIAYSSDTVSGCGAVVVSGSRDATVLVWHWSSRLQRFSGGEHVQSGEVASPQAILTGHELPIVCVAVHADVGKVVSCSQGGRCLVHTASGEVLHSLNPSYICSKPHQACITSQGHILLLYADGKGLLTVFDGNGCLMASSKLKHQVLALTASQDGTFVVSAGMSRCVEVRRCHNLTVVQTYSQCESSIRTLATVSDEKFIVAGLASGSLVAFPVEWNLWC